MSVWTGVALALTEVGDDAMASRLSTYLHPLAGRPLIWHTLSELASLRPSPGRLIVVARPEIPPELFQDLGAEVQVTVPEGGDLWRVVEAAGLPAGSGLLVVDAAAPVLRPFMRGLAFEPPGWAVPAEGGSVGAAFLPFDAARRLLARVSGMEQLAEALPTGELAANGRIPVVRNRVQLARAIQRIRDRIVERLARGGVTFLLPGSVLVDVDVHIGRDTVIFPGVVLEGNTTIGAETVIGPGCRIIDSQIGSGVELKGWNYISRTSIRNRAILEPYVRRGFD